MRDIAPKLDINTRYNVTGYFPTGCKISQMPVNLREAINATNWCLLSIEHVVGWPNDDDSLYLWRNFRFISLKLGVRNNMMMQLSPQHRELNDRA